MQLGWVQQAGSAMPKNKRHTAIGCVLLASVGILALGKYAESRIYQERPAEIAS